MFSEIYVLRAEIEELTRLVYRVSADLRTTIQEVDQLKINLEDLKYSHDTTKETGHTTLTSVETLLQDVEKIETKLAAVEDAVTDLYVGEVG
jgi:hypothetical protein